MSEIRAQEPTAAEIEQASARVRQRLFPAAQSHAGAATAPSEVARASSNFCQPRSPVLSIPAASFFSTPTFANASSAAAQLDRLRRGAASVVVMPTPPQRSVNYQVWAVAASVVLVTGAVAYWGVYEFPALHGGPRATVEQIDGALYSVSGRLSFPPLRRYGTGRKRYRPHREKFHRHSPPE